MNKILKISLKTLAGVGVAGGIGAGAAAIALGTGMHKDKEKNAENPDTGSISSFSNHLFSTGKDIDLGQRAIDNGGLKLLNLGDSIAHGAYTWDITDGVKYDPRGEAAYGFLTDAFQKEGILEKDEVIDYSTSKSGLRLFELLNWIKNGQVDDLTQDPVYKDGTRGPNRINVSEKTKITKEIASKNLVKEIKNNDVITVSIGGNDIIGLLKVLGQNFHDLNFDDIDVGSLLPKLLGALKGGSIGDVIGFDLDGMDGLLAELESNIQQMLQTIHAINPDAVVVLFREPNPALHWPKILRNILDPIYGKIAEIEKRVIGWTDEDSKNNGYDQKSGALNWATFVETTQDVPGIADKYDVYNAHSLDIHPTIEGQAKLAQGIAANLVTRYKLNPSLNDYFTDKSVILTDEEKEKYGDLLTGVPVRDRIEQVRIWHNMGSTEKEILDSVTKKYRTDHKIAEETKLSEKDLKAINLEYDKQRDADLKLISDDIKSKGTKNTSGKPIDVVDLGYATGGELNVVDEKDSSATHSIVRSLTGVIDGLTDRIPLRRSLALKNANFELYNKEATFGSLLISRPKSFEEYRKAVGILESRASTAYEIYQARHKGNWDQYDKDGNPLKVWKDIKIAWFINHYQAGIIGQDKKLFSNVSQKQIDAYKFGDLIMKDMAKDKSDALKVDKEATNWDLDHDGRFSVSDVQLGMLLDLLSSSGDMFARNGRLDKIIDIQDVKNLLPTLLLQLLGQTGVDHPDFNSATGFKNIPHKDISYDGAGRFFEQHEEDSGIGMIAALLGDMGSRWETTYKSMITGLLSTMGLGSSSGSSAGGGIMDTLKGIISGKGDTFKGQNMSLSMDYAALSQLVTQLAGDTIGQEYIFRFLNNAIFDKDILVKISGLLKGSISKPKLKIIGLVNLNKSILDNLTDTLTKQLGGFIASIEKSLHYLNDKKTANKQIKDAWTSAFEKSLKSLVNEVKSNGFSLGAISTLLNSLKNPIKDLAAGTNNNDLEDALKDAIGLLSLVN